MRPARPKSALRRSASMHWARLQAAHVSHLVPRCRCRETPWAGAASASRLAISRESRTQRYRSQSMCAECFEQTRQHLEHDRLTRGPEGRVAIMQK